ncbi:two-component regulator propeller domain-containing protein [Vibrio olivae]
MVANQLFLGPSGGIWLHDAKYRIKVFDGVGVLPENGSVFDVATAHLTYQNHAFWTFVGNEVYRLLPGRERQPEFNLTPGSEITQIGASQGYLWLTDQSQFYAYYIETQVLDVYPLSRIYQYNQALNVVINDAQHIDGEWVLATNAGVYISRSNGFRYVSASNKRPVSQLFFSKTRRELLVGSDDGALVIDVDSGSDEPVERIGHGQVTAMIESDGAYWIGSDKGLYLYSVFTGQTDYLKGDTHQGHQLRGEHIYALLNDRQGGIWVSTEFGVQYHSLFGDQFKRYAQPVFDEAQHQLTPEMISLAQTKGHYWFLSDSGLHQLKHSGQQAKTFYSGKVFDYAEDEQWVWLATSQGVKVVDADSGVLNTQRNLPSLLRDKSTHLIEITSTGDVLGVTQSVLWRYQLETGALKQWHLSQLNPQSLQAGRWQLFAAQDGTVVLSGDSAISVIRGETVHTIKGSQKIGRISQWVNISEHQLWAVGHYGIYQLDTQQLSLSDVMMPAEGVMPQCVVRNQDGLWLSSSFGLSRYDMSGQLLAHYSAPFGVIHNEFTECLCECGR